MRLFCMPSLHANVHTAYTLLTSQLYVSLSLSLYADRLPVDLNPLYLTPSSSIVDFSKRAWKKCVYTKTEGGKQAYKKEW